MKIVQLCPYAMDRPGGVQRHVRDLSDWLNQQGHETRIIAPPTPGQRPRARAPLTELGRSRAIGLHGTGFEISRAAPWAVRRLARELRDWGAELVHMHTPWTPWVVGQMFRALSLPTVTTIHATLPTADGAGIIDRYIHRSARAFVGQSAAVIAPSEAPLAMLRRLVPDLGVNILPPCVDLAEFQPGKKTPQSLLFLGRLEPRKGLDILLDAWPTILRARPDARLCIAGEGPLRPQAEATKGVTYVGRPDDTEARRLMAQSDLFLAPAPYGESYGLVLAEAMAAGAIPVAAANEGYTHVMRNLPELLVQPSDAKALAAKVTKLLGSGRDVLRSRLASEALASDVATVGPAYIDLFRAARDVR